MALAAATVRDPTSVLQTVADVARTLFHRNQQIDMLTTAIGVVMYAHCFTRHLWDVINAVLHLNVSYRTVTILIDKSTSVYKRALKMLVARYEVVVVYDNVQLRFFEQNNTQRVLDWIHWYI